MGVGGLWGLLLEVMALNIQRETEAQRGWGLGVLSCPQAYSVLL